MGWGGGGSHCPGLTREWQSDKLEAELQTCVKGLVEASGSNLQGSGSQLHLYTLLGTMIHLILALALLLNPCFSVATPECLALHIFGL